MCELLLASVIAGAYEFTPGSMRVELIQPSTPDVIDVAFVYTDDYLACLERPQD